MGDYASPTDRPPSYDAHGMAPPREKS